MAQTFHLYDTQRRTYASKTVFQILYSSNTITQVTHGFTSQSTAGETDAVLPGYLLHCTTDR